MFARQPSLERRPQRASPRRADAAEHEADRAAAEAMTGGVRSPLGAARGAAEPARLPGNGRALDSATRVDMERRFGHSFARVRVHADAAAQRAASALGAQAFAHGPNIVFGAGRFAPQTGTGRHLLAHELAHVVQQSRSGAATRPMLAPEAPAKARPATAAEKQAFAREAVNFLRGQSDFFTSLPTPREPAKTLPDLRSTLNNGLQALDADTSDDALKLAKELRGVYTGAVRLVLDALTKVKPAAGSKAPTLAELYERHRADIEPFAHPVDTGAQALSAELEARLPAGATAAQRTRHAALANARQRLQVSTSSIDMGYADLFGPNAGSPKALPTGTSARFASTVPAVLQAGLTGLVERMLTSGILAANTTLMLALDLRAFGGGNDAYRFTRLDLGTAARPDNEGLIERQGAILTEGLSAPERKQLRERFDRVAFKRGVGFSDGEFDEVLIGLGEIPESQLSSLGALSFTRRAAHATSPTTLAEYTTNDHTVTVFDRAYSNSIARQGRAGRVLKAAAFSVAHEVGHAQDFSTLRTTSAANQVAQAALVNQFGTGGNNWGIAGNAPAADRTRYDALAATRATARRAQMAARSRSGARWGGSGAVDQVTDTLTPRAPTPAFRAAAMLDDGPRAPRMPTDYPNPDSVWREYYAECYALYETSPDLLRRIRPHVFDHLKAEFPK